MIPAPKHDLIPGDPISVGDLRDFYASVQDLGNFSVDTPLNLQRGPGGYHLRLDIDELTSLIGTLIEITNLTINNFFLTTDGTFTWEGHGEFTPRDVVTNVCPTNLSQEKAVTAATTGVNSTSWVDLTGSSATFTVTKATTAQIVATWDIAGNGNAVTDDVYSGAMNIDTSRETLLGVLATYGPNARATVSQSYLVSLGAGSHTIKLQGQRTSGSGSADFEVNSGWTLIGVPVVTVSTATGIAIAPEVCADDPADCCPDTWWCVTASGGTPTCFQGTEQEAYTEAGVGGTVAGPYTLEADCTFVCESSWWCITPAAGDTYCFEGTESEADTEAGAGTYDGPHADEATCQATCLVPGASCAAAGTMTATTVYGPFVCAIGADNWFSVSHAGGAFHIDLVITDNAGITAILDVLDACGGSTVLTQPLSGTGTVCYGTTTGAATLKIRVQGGSDPITYTIAYNTGTC